MVQILLNVLYQAMEQFSTQFKSVVQIVFSVLYQVHGAVASQFKSVIRMLYSILYQVHGQLSTQSKALVQLFFNVNTAIQAIMTAIVHCKLSEPVVHVSPSGKGVGMHPN